MEKVETVIVGGGQAGLATSYYLTQHGHEHVVLEQAARAGNAWRSGRWDSFTLVTPNWALKMPGAEYDGPDRDGFMPREDVVTYFERYAERLALPVQYNTHVDFIEPADDGGYRVQTSERTIQSRNVVIATGQEQMHRMPPSASDLSQDIYQLHSSRYRNPDSLPEGAVLVVGSAQSGCQIAEELNQSGRRVFLCTSGAGRVPRRYRGRDIFEWLNVIGFLDMTPDKLPVPREHFAPPHLSGKNGGHTINLHQFAKAGVTLLGHMVGGADHRISFAPDLLANLARADGFERQVKSMVDGYIQANGLDTPEEELPQLQDGLQQPIIEDLDLAAAGINTVIWATGYRFDASLAKLPITDSGGFPVQTGGVTDHPGLYLVGLPFMPSLRSGILVGVGESAKHIADCCVTEADKGRRIRPAA